MNPKKHAMRALTTISQLTWGLAILALPLGRFLLLEQAGDSGRFNPYASVTLQMSEGLILVAFLAWALGNGKAFKIASSKNRRLQMAVALTALIMLPMLWAENFEVALGAIIPLMAGIAAIALVRQNVLPKKTVATLFVGTMVLQAILGMTQVALGHWGDLSAYEAGVAKMMIAGKSFLRAYGTFSHPNILAGYLVVALALIPSIHKKRKNLKRLLGTVLGMGLLVTASKGAILGLLITLFIMSKRSAQKKSFIALLVALAILATLPFWRSAEFITERLAYVKISIAMLLQQPWGVGPHHFTLAMQQFTDLKLQPWQFQPVHNIYLLAANEWGVWMGILLAFGGIHLLRHHLKKPTLLVILPLLLIGLVDHYLVSLPQGVLLTGLVIGWITAESKNHTKIVPAKSK